MFHLCVIKILINPSISHLIRQNLSAHVQFWCFRSAGTVEALVSPSPGYSPAIYVPSYLYEVDGVVGNGSVLSARGGAGAWGVGQRWQR